MSGETYKWLVWVVLIWVAILWMVVLSGCAAEPDPPIRAYREAYGFTP